MPEHLQAVGHLLEKLTPSQQQIYTVRMSSDPPKTAREVAEILDVHQGTVVAHWTRIKQALGFDPLLKWKESGKMQAQLGTQAEKDAFIALRNVAPDTFIKLNEMSQEKLLRRLYHNADDVPVERIPDMIHKLTGARALVKGEPTQILRVEQRENLHKILPQIMKELERRKLMIDGDGVKPVPTTIEAESA